MAKDQVKPELWKSRSINFHLTSRYPQVLSLVDSVLVELITHIKNRDNPKRIHTEKLKKSLSLLLLNLYSLHKVNRKKYLAYPRNPNGFQRTRYKKHNIGFNVFIKVVDTLEELGYIVLHKTTAVALNDHINDNEFTLNEESISIIIKLIASSREFQMT